VNRHDDTHVLTQLRSALATVPARPDPTEFAALDRAVAASRQGRAPVTRLAPRRRARILDHPRIAAIGVVATTLSLGTGVAAAAGMPVLRGIREVAHDIGLPVEAPAVVDAKDALTQLRDALARSDSAQVRGARDRLRQELRGLSGSEREAMQHRAGALLRVADDRLAGESRGAAAPGPRGAGPAGPTATRPPTSERGDTSGDHSSNRTGDDGSHSGTSQPAAGGDSSGDNLKAPGRDSQPTTPTTVDQVESKVDDSHGGSASGGHGGTTSTTATPIDN
jgi:hypothetical protein